MATKLSIILCSFNEGRRLRETVDSILAVTTYPDYEVVVVDNRSVDGSFDFVDAPPYASEPRLVPVQNLRNVGVSRGRHSGTRAASGDVLIFLDAHMIVPPGWCEKIVKSFREIERLGALALKCYDMAHPEHGRTNGYSIYSNRSYLFNSPAWVGKFDYAGPRKVPFVNGGAICIARDVYDEVGGFPQFLEGWGHDDVGLSLAVYYHGYDCYVDADVPVGHYYKTIEETALPPGTDPAEKHPTHWTLYNSLAFAFVLLDDDGFEQALERARKRAHFEEIHAYFAERREELREVRERLRGRALRTYADFQREFDEYLVYRYVGAYERGVHLTSQRRFEEARREYQAAKGLRHSYGHIEADTYQGMIALREAESYFFEGRYRDCLRCAFEALQSNPRYAPTLRRIGQAYEQLQEREKSLFWLRIAESHLGTVAEQANELSCGDFNDLEDSLLDSLSMVLFHLRDYAGARACVERLLVKKPSDERLRANLELFRRSTAAGSG